MYIVLQILGQGTCSVTWKYSVMLSKQEETGTSIPSYITFC